MWQLPVPAAETGSGFSFCWGVLDVVLPGGQQGGVVPQRGVLSLRV